MRKRNQVVVNVLMEPADRIKKQGPKITVLLAVIMVTPVSLGGRLLEGKIRMVNEIRKLNVVFVAMRVSKYANLSTKVEPVDLVINVDTCMC